MSKSAAMSKGSLGANSRTVTRSVNFLQVAEFHPHTCLFEPVGPARAASDPPARGVVAVSPVSQRPPRPGTLGIRDPRTFVAPV